MSVRITCPSCETPYTVADTQRGKKLVCRECKETITVPLAKAPAPAPAAPRTEAVTERKPRPAAKAPARHEDDEEDTPRPRKKRDHDEEEARPRKKVVKAVEPADEDEDEEERPRKKKGKAAKKAGALSPLMIGATVGAVALIVVAVVVVMLAIQPKKPAPPAPGARGPGGPPPVLGMKGGGFDDRMPPDAGPPGEFRPPPVGEPAGQPPADPPAAEASSAAQPPAGDPTAKDPAPLPALGKAENPPANPLPPLGKAQPNDPPAKDPTPASDPNPAPGGSGGLQLDRAVLTRVKLATLYLRVTLPDGKVSQGSGFFGVEPGLVLTNAHVLGMLDPDSRRPRKVEIVYKSGEPDARTFVGEILGVDRTSDLAVLRVKGADLPKPLDVRPAKDLIETQQVYIVGFPLGDTLGTNVTVSGSSVSSLRKNSAGDLEQVQVNGGMHPGNSGGPVVNARGEVVGVAVAGIKGTQLNFAVPGEFVHAILNGRITTLALGDTLRDGKNLKVPFKLSVLDPLGRMQKTVVEFWVGKPGPARRSSTTAPPALEGDGPRQRVEVRPKTEGQRGEYTLDGEFTLPARGAGQALWIQPAFVNGTGQARWLAAAVHTPSSPLDRVPITLALRHQAGGRLVSVSNQFGLKILGGSNKAVNIDVNVETKLAESMTGYDANRGLAAVRLRYHEFKVHDPRNVIPADSTIARGLKLAAQEIKKVSANLVVDPTGKLVKNEVDVTRVSPQAHEAMAELHTKIQRSLESVEVIVPNRAVQPGETWMARRRILIVTGEHTQEGTADYYYTYQGVRERDGRKEAILSIAGQARGPDGRELKLGGKVSGHARFDVSAGQFAEVVVKTVVDVDIGEGVRGVGTITSKLQRSLGKDVYSTRGQLTNRDPRDADGRFLKVHKLKLTAGRTYTISLESFLGDGYFDTYLRVESGAGRPLTQDDNGGVDFNSLIIFRPERTDTYRIVVTSPQPGTTGTYALVIRER